MSNSRDIRVAAGQFALRAGVNQVVVPLTGDVITAREACTDLTLVPAGQLATLTVKFPKAPAEGDEFCITSSFGITALTLDGNGRGILAPIGVLTTGGFATYKFRTFGSTWYRKG